MADLTDGSTFPSPTPTFRDYVERLMSKYGDYSVLAFTWENEVTEVPSTGLYVKYAPTGAVELHFSLDARRPELVPWAQSGDYESTPDLDALVDNAGH